ncbi:MAG TPA: T9SS type A sorting domain-containing protein, partial [Bacteroidia bacterium]|nr:T9SS type A sorting domain-containing protein [Bacteroidia bacterium]
APAGGTYSGPGVTAGSFSAASAGIGTHTITYTYTDNNTGCTNTASKTIVVNNCNCVTPSVPSSITGLTPVCAGASSVYSVTNVATVTSYNWVAPANATITAGQGTNSVTVQFGANYTTGSLCVAAVNACGGSLPRCKTITKKASSTPGNILGQLSGHCETVVNLSVNPVSGAQSYNWTLPANTSLISGQGTNSISFSTLPGFVSGSVCVTQFNGCVNSTARCATIYSAPAKPVISGPATVCAGQTNLTYSIPASYGATTYTWTVPAGSTIVSGQGTTSIVVNFGSTAGKVTVIAKNACGNRGTATFNVAINCRMSDANYNAFDLLVSPNPASTSTEVRISGNTGEKATLTVTNVLGKDVYTETKTLNSEKLFTLDLTGFSKGIYMVSVSSGNNRKAVRLVVD